MLVFVKCVVHHHQSDYQNTKQTELEEIMKAREEADKQYMAMADLQSLINEANNYKEEIEDMHVSLQHLSIQIKELEDGVEFLQEKKEELDD